MFSLIISIIAIALVAALAAASVYYGGSAFNKGTAGADASTFMNNGQQINGAFTLAATDGKTITDVDGLVTDGYLSQEPSYKGVPLEINQLNNNFVSVVVSSQVCDELVDNRGGQDAAMLAADTLFGCDKTGGSLTAFYKVK